MAAAVGQHPHNFDDHVFLLLAFVALAVGAGGAAVALSPIRRRLMGRGRA